MHFARFAVRGPKGVGMGSADQPMLPSGWTEGVAKSQARVHTLNAPTLDPFGMTSQQIADITQADQRVARCAACTSKARDVEVVESAGAKVASIIGAGGGFVGGKH